MSTTVVVKKSWNTEALFVPTIKPYILRAWVAFLQCCDCCPSLMVALSCMPCFIRIYTLPIVAVIYGTKGGTASNLEVWLNVYAGIKALPGLLFYAMFGLCFRYQCYVFIDAASFLARLANLFHIAWWAVGVAWWSQASLSCSPAQVLGIVILTVEGLGVLETLLVIKKNEDESKVDNPTAQNAV